MQESLCPKSVEEWDTDFALQIGGCEPSHCRDNSSPSHPCASLLVSLDVNMEVIQRYLGHSNMSTTADIYSHLDANATGEAGMKLGRLLADDEEVN